jgi:hypothetical protein
MMSQLDLLSYIASNPYPKSSGYKQSTTSKEAAARVDRGWFKEWSYRKITECLTLGGATVKEILSWMHDNYPIEMQGRDVTHLRPRATEMKIRSLLEDSGLRREGQVVWRLR